jgi:hypothetical protein
LELGRAVDGQLPPRDGWINAYPELLVVFDANNEKSYWQFEEREGGRREVIPEEIDGIRGLVLQGLEGIRGRELTARQIAVKPNDAAPGEVDAEWPIVSMQSIDSTGGADIEIEKKIGGGRHPGNQSPPIRLSLTSCAGQGWSSRDACLTCCANNRGTSYALAVTSAIAVAIACINAGPFAGICFALAGAAAAAFIIWIEVDYKNCIVQCQGAYP